MVHFFFNLEEKICEKFRDASWNKKSHPSKTGQNLYIQIEYVSFGDFTPVEWSIRKIVKGEFTIQSLFATGWYQNIEIVNFAKTDVINDSSGYTSADLIINYPNQFQNNPLLFYCPFNTGENIYFNLKMIEWDLVKKNVIDAFQQGSDIIKELKIPFVIQYEEIIQQVLSTTKKIFNWWNDSSLSKQDWFYENVKIEPKEDTNPRIKSFKFEGNDPTYKNIKYAPDDINYLKKEEIIEDQLILLIPDTETDDYKIKVDENSVNVTYTNKKDEKTKSYVFDCDGKLVLLDDPTINLKKIPYIVLRVHGEPNCAIFETKPDYNLFTLIGTVNNAKSYIAGMFKLENKNPITDVEYDLTKLQELTCEWIDLKNDAKNNVNTFQGNNGAWSSALQEFYNKWWDIAYRFNLVYKRIPSEGLQVKYQKELEDWNNSYEKNILKELEFPFNGRDTIELSINQLPDNCDKNKELSTKKETQ